MKRTVKNPLERTRRPLLPPASRSRAALGLAVAAAQGRFALQMCAACGTAQYPPREVCSTCLSPDLPWREVPGTGTLTALTTVRIAADPYFRERTPWRIGLVALACGPNVVAHLAADIRPGAAVRLTLKLDAAGQGVMVALPAETSQMPREFTADPAGRRVLVTDGRHATGPAMARAFLQAGAASVHVGVADAWRPFPQRDALLAIGVGLVELDVTDTGSVHRLAASLGGQVEILVNTALHLRPATDGLIAAREEMETSYFGLLRLARHFGPALQARAADGSHPACAWVNVIGVDALAGTSPAQAAVQAVAQGLRASLRPIRVVNALVGALDDDWHQGVPPPKVSPSALAAAVVAALLAGIEDVAVGDIAQDRLARFVDNPAILARDR